MATQPKASQQSNPDDLATVLSQVMRKTPDIEGMMLLRDDGEVVAASGPHEEQLRRLASFAVGVYDLSIRLAEVSGRGELDFHLVRTDEGHLILHRIDESHILFSIAASDTPLGLITHDIGWCAERMKRLV